MLNTLYRFLSTESSATLHLYSKSAYLLNKSREDLYVDTQDFSVIYRSSLLFGFKSPNKAYKVSVSLIVLCGYNISFLYLNKPLLPISIEALIGSV